MKKWLLIILCLVVLILAVRVAWPPHGFAKINYVGKSREQIADECAQYDRFLDGKIMILDEDESAFRYFDTAEEIRSDPHTMSARQWGINFRRAIVRTHFFVVTFENDVVVSQRKSWYGDI